MSGYNNKLFREELFYEISKKFLVRTGEGWRRESLGDFVGTMNWLQSDIDETGLSLEEYLVERIADLYLHISEQTGQKLHLLSDNTVNLRFYIEANWIDETKCFCKEQSEKKIKEIEKALDNKNKKIKRIEKNLLRVPGQVEKWEKDLQETQKETEQIEKNLLKIPEQAEKWKKDLQKNQEELKRIKKRLDEAPRKVEKWKKDLQESQEKLKRLKKRLDEAPEKAACWERDCEKAFKKVWDDFSKCEAFNQSICNISQHALAEFIFEKTMEGHLPTEAWRYQFFRIIFSEEKLDQFAFSYAINSKGMGADIRNWVRGKSSSVVQTDEWIDLLAALNLRHLQLLESSLFTPDAKLDIAEWKYQFGCNDYCRLYNRSISDMVAYIAILGYKNAGWVRTHRKSLGQFCLTRQKENAAKFERNSTYDDKIDDSQTKGYTDEIETQDWMRRINDALGANGNAELAICEFKSMINANPEFFYYERESDQEVLREEKSLAKKKGSTALEGSYCPHHFIRRYTLAYAMAITRAKIGGEELNRHKSLDELEEIVKAQLDVYLSEPEDVTEKGSKIGEEELSTDILSAWVDLAKELIALERAGNMAIQQNLFQALKREFCVGAILRNTDDFSHEHDADFDWYTDAPRVVRAILINAIMNADNISDESEVNWYLNICGFIPLTERNAWDWYVLQIIALEEARRKEERAAFFKEDNDE